MEIPCKELSFHRKRFAASAPSEQHSHEGVTYSGGMEGLLNTHLKVPPQFDVFVSLISGTFWKSQTYLVSNAIC